MTWKHAQSSRRERQVKKQHGDDAVHVGQRCVLGPRARGGGLLLSTVGPERLLGGLGAGLSLPRYRGQEGAGDHAGQRTGEAKTQRNPTRDGSQGEDGD